MHSKHINQKLKCTGDKQWYSRAAHHNWIRVQTLQHLEEQGLSKKALQECMPYHMLRLFKLRVIYPHGRNTFYLAYIEVTQPANDGMPKSASQLVRVVKLSSEGAYALWAGVGRWMQAGWTRSS
jgi:hypothetical protein